MDLRSALRPGAFPLVSAFKQLFDAIDCRFVGLVTSSTSSCSLPPMSATSRRMKLLLPFLAFTASIFAADNELTDAEKSGGWKLIFDGKDAAGHWRGYKKDSLPGKWVVKDGRSR